MVGVAVGRAQYDAPAPTRVNIDNRSGQAIVGIELIGRSDPLLAPGRTLGIVHDAGGDAGFDLRVTLADGSAREIGNLYLDGGSTETVAITPED